jgi:hypothetical protein
MMMRCLLWVLVLVALSITMAAPALSAPAGERNPGVIPLSAKVGGLTYAEWGDRWVRWWAAFPLSVDPLANPGLGQDPASPVFFLPSANGPPIDGPFTLEGAITVPADKLLLMPVTWAVNAMIPLDCCPMTAQEFLQCAPPGLEAWLLHATNNDQDLYAVLDDQPFVDVAQFRVHSAAPFQVAWSADSVWNAAPCGQQLGAFTSDVVWCDGYWMLLTPLSAGEHTLRFGSGWLRTTLHLTVTAR